MNFDKLVHFILEGFLPKNFFPTSRAKPKPFVEPVVHTPTAKMDRKGWLKNNTTWIPVTGVHARPVYVNMLNAGRKDRPTEHIISRDSLERCILDGHTRVALNVGTIHIECRNLATGKKALQVLQSLFSDVDDKKISIDVLDEGSFEVDIEGHILSRRIYGKGDYNPYALD